MVLDAIAAAAVTVLALALVVIAVLGYRRSRERGLLFLLVAFGLFVVKGALLSASVFLGTPALDVYAVTAALADALILGLMYAMTLRR